MNAAELHISQAHVHKLLCAKNPDAALLWFSRLMYAGVDPKLIVRRLIVHASEDVGLAEPTAMLQAHAAANALEFVGMPEARIPLGDAAVLMATSPKSNTGHVALDMAMADIKKGKAYDFPRHLQNMHADTYTMEREQGYRYPHDYPGHWVRQEYMPPEVKGKKYYKPTEMGHEATILKNQQAREGKPSMELDTVVEALTAMIGVMN